MITALTSSVDFIYTFEYNNETIEYQLKDGESIIFDPDLVKHGMKNKSKTMGRPWWFDIGWFCKIIMCQN